MPRARLELFVVEGSRAGTSIELDRPVLVLGRRDAADASDPRRITFDDASLPLIQAFLRWNDEKRCYVIEHRSPVQPTVVNGSSVSTSHALRMGDRIRIGANTLQLRRVVDYPVRGGTYEGSRAVVVMGGVESGRVIPLKRPLTRLCTPPAEEEESLESFSVAGLESWHIDLSLGSEHLFMECFERPCMVAQWPGLVYCRLPGSGERVDVPKGSVLVFGDVALITTELEQAAWMAEALREGRPVGNPVIDEICLGEPPYYMPGDVDFEYVLRVLSGTDRGSALYIEPFLLEGPIVVGKPGARSDLHLELPERDCATFEITIAHGRPEALNVDATMNLNVNFDTLKPDDSTPLVSGDRLTMGRTMVSFEHRRLQSVIESLGVQWGDEVVPLLRAQNTIGHRLENDVRIDDRRICSRHGVIEVKGKGWVVYRPLDRMGRSQINGAEVSFGNEVSLRVGDRLHLNGSVEVTLVERDSPSPDGLLA